jgi:ADP-ribosylglycohydrolase
MADQACLARTRACLTGLAIGDAFGETMASPAGARRIAKRLLPLVRPWRWTDDTAMALSIVAILERYGTIDPAHLARAFVARWRADPDRGYGLGTATLFERVNAGGAWRVEAQRLFRGTGSFGNGAAMRAAPIGAFFAPDLDRIRAEALRSAEPTHAHPDGAAGAVAVAVAAGLASLRISGTAMLDAVIDATPETATRDGLRRARELGFGVEPRCAGDQLGTGHDVSSRDTVPFCLWIAARQLDSYEDAIWAATSEPGDHDTNGAIVGGIIACATGLSGIPLLWQAAVEPLPPPIGIQGGEPRRSIRR